MHETEARVLLSMKQTGDGAFVGSVPPCTPTPRAARAQRTWIPDPSPSLPLAEGPPGHPSRPAELSVKIQKKSFFYIYIEFCDFIVKYFYLIKIVRVYEIFWLPLRFRCDRTCPRLLHVGCSDEKLPVAVGTERRTRTAALMPAKRRAAPPGG